MAKKKKPKMHVMWMIISNDEHQLFLCYDHKESKIEFVAEFEDKISLFKNEKDTNDFIRHFGKQIGVKLKGIKIPLGELLDDSKVSHILENIGEEELKKIIEEQRNDDVCQSLNCGITRSMHNIVNHPFKERGEDNDVVGN